MNTNQQPSKIRDTIRARLPDLIGELRTKARSHGASGEREAGYTIRNATGDEAVIRIYDEIWWLGVNAEDIASELDAITAPQIRVEINSPGGDVWDGVAIYNALRNHPAQVTTRIDGMAASIASIIFQAGDRRIVHASSQMMIHNAWGLTVGDYRDHEEMASILRQQNKVLSGIYAAHGSEPAEHYQGLMDAETWMVGGEIIDQGLADEVIEPANDEVAASFHDRVVATVSAVADVIKDAEQVSAVRAEAGKPLSQRIRDDLSGLSDEASRIDALLNPESLSGDDGDHHQLAALYDRLYARQAGRSTPLGVTSP